MKKSILGLAVSALFVVGAAQAGTNANDVSATLNVTGTVTNNDMGCAVNLAQSSVKLTGDVQTLPAQGADALPTQLVQLSVTGNEFCTDLAKNNKMAYKLLGTADNADGNAIANSDSGEGAASGVGIALYNVSGTQLDVNSGTLPVTDGITSLGLGLVKLTGQETVPGTVKGTLTIQIERL